MPIDRAAVVAGSIRLASGVSFLVDLCVRTDCGESRTIRDHPRLLLRSMGYRDALIGGLLVSAAHPLWLDACSPSSAGPGVRRRSRPCR
jgi:hypothetical protein